MKACLQWMMRADENEAATSGTKRLRYVSPIIASHRQPDYVVRQNLSNQGGCEGRPWAAAPKVEKVRGTRFQVKLNSQVELNATRAVSGNAGGHWYAWFVDGEVVVVGGYATKLHGVEFEAIR
jgi:hypothetical protein